MMLDHDQLNPQGQTDIIPDQSLAQRHIMENDTNPMDIPAIKPEQCSVSLIIKGITETIHLQPKQSFVLGRFSTDNTHDIHLDLSLYGGEKYGVSRVHATIQFASTGHLYLTDLDSTNGTFVGAAALTSFQPKLLRHNDVITLGSLPMRLNLQAP